MLRHSLTHTGYNVSGLAASLALLVEREVDRTIVPIVARLEALQEAQGGIIDTASRKLSAEIADALGLGDQLAMTIINALGDLDLPDEGEDR